MRTLATLALVIPLASCGFPPPQPRDRWPMPSPQLAAHEVLIEGEVKIPSLAEQPFRGNGVIYSSSREKGTYIVTCWHVACSPIDLLRLDEGTEASGPVGHKTSVFVHENALVKPGGWREWKHFEGRVIFGKSKVIKNTRPPVDGGQAAASAKFLNEFSILDVAVVHLSTEEETLKAVTINIGERVVGNRGIVRGIEGRSGLPFERPATFLSDRFFAADEKSTSGSGVYDEEGRLVGVLSAYFPCLPRIEQEGRTQTFRLAHYFVPSSMILTACKYAPADLDLPK